MEKITSIEEAKKYAKHYGMVPDCPEEYLTQEVYDEIFKKRTMSIQNIPMEFRSLEMCKIAVRYVGGLLHAVPEKFKTYELCLEAIKHGSSAIEYIPDEFKDFEICYYASIKNNYLQWTDYIPKNIKEVKFKIDITDKFCLFDYLIFSDKGRIEPHYYYKGCTANKEGKIEKGYLKMEYVREAIMKASIEELDHIAGYIPPYIIPEELLPLFINCKSKKISEYVKYCFTKRDSDE